MQRWFDALLAPGCKLDLGMQIVKDDNGAISSPPDSLKNTLTSITLLFDEDKYFDSGHGDGDHDTVLDLSHLRNMESLQTITVDDSDVRRLCLKGFNELPAHVRTVVVKCSECYPSFQDLRVDDWKIHTVTEYRVSNIFVSRL